MAIPGYPIMNGAGLRSTMGAGAMMIIMAGNGSRAMNGHRHGLAGGTAAVITDGRLYSQASASAYLLVIVTVYLIITGFALRRLILTGPIFTTIMYRKPAW